MLPLVDPPPDTCLDDTFPRSPEITATEAFAGACAVAADTSVLATAVIRIAAATIKRTQRVWQVPTWRRPACSDGSRAARTRPAAPRTTRTPSRRRCWRA